MQEAIDILKGFDIETEVDIVSAHRTPEKLFDFSKNAHERGISVIIAGAGGAAVGVLYEPAASGYDVGVAIGGIVTVYAGGTVAVGAKVLSNASGYAVTATATNQVLGIARTAGASGALMEIYWQPQGILAA